MALICCGVNAGTMCSLAARGVAPNRGGKSVGHGIGRLTGDRGHPHPDPAGETARPGPTCLGPVAPDRAASYRHDLDGLRGIAIALVAIFHVWFGRVSGGVDVFLALSGFFFGSSLLRTALRPGASLSPWPHVKRLARRLLPALVTVLAAAAVLTVLIQPQTRWVAANQCLASLGYYQNWELSATASDYLRAGETVSPLQHIWSMSVQGQFYISFLLLILGFTAAFRRLGSRRLRTAFIALLTVLTVASFVCAIIAHQTDQVSAYYNSFARAWELLLGVLVRARWCPISAGRCGCAPLLAGVGLAAILSCGRSSTASNVPGTVGAGAGRRRGAAHPGRGQPRSPAVHGTASRRPIGCWPANRW